MGRAVDAVIAAGLAGILVAGCGPSGEAGRNGDPEREMRKHEGEFRPSEFDPDPSTLLQRNKVTESDTLDGNDLVAPPTTTEMVAGFRVQIFSSTDIDEATAVKDTAGAQFPAEWFYLVYEPPTYKVRAGDLLTRYDADRLAKILREGGYSDSWIVPDRVYRTPPPRSHSNEN